jgi:hypothetical protein
MLQDGRESADANKFAVMSKPMIPQANETDSRPNAGFWKNNKLDISYKLNRSLSDNPDG